jgi:hypothetical protein
VPQEGDEASGQVVGGADGMSVWLLVWLLPGSQEVVASDEYAIWLGKSGGRNWDRTSDPSLVSVVGKSNISDI